MSVKKPTAFICQCAQDADRIEHLLNLAGFNVQSNMSLPAIVQAMSDSHEPQADMVISAVQEGGLAVAQMVQQLETPNKPRVVLFDTHGDVPSAMKALRLRVEDYLLASEGEDALLHRLTLLAHRIELMTQELEAVPSDLMHAGLMHAPALATAGNGHTNGNGAHHTHQVWWDASLCAIRSDDMWVPLSPIEWKLFETLVNKRGAVVTTEDLILLALARTGTTASDTSLLRLHVSRLRAKLNEHFSHELSIVTMRGRGYMLV
jgi:DNA-binding response OmpR family regulator